MNERAGVDEVPVVPEIDVYRARELEDEKDDVEDEDARNDDGGDGRREGHRRSHRPADVEDVEPQHLREGHTPRSRM
jgi:hypothetical protein